LITITGIKQLSLWAKREYSDELMPSNAVIIIKSGNSVSLYVYREGEDKNIWLHILEGKLVLY
jgi:hypothetical protein